MAITINGSGTITGISEGGLNDDSIAIADLSATGTPSASTYLCGNNTWATPTGGTGRKVLEQFLCPCDGSVIATSNGDITITDKDDVQNLTTSYADIVGSSIAYNPPTGTTQVIYEYQFNGMRDDDIDPLAHVKFFIDSDEVTDARTNFAGQHAQMNMIFKWAMNIGGSAVTATGRQASWSSAKTLKLQMREYGSDNEMKLNETVYWDGGASVDPQFHRPQIGITAIG